MFDRISSYQRLNPEIISLSIVLSKGIRQFAVRHEAGEVGPEESEFVDDPVINHSFKWSRDILVCELAAA